MKRASTATRFAHDRLANGILAALIASISWASAARANDPPNPVAAALAMEQADRLPLTTFYSTPGNLSETRPGDLLRSEPFDGYALPKGATAVRILYHSLSSTGADVATSGVVLIPAGTPPPGGWPIIAWAHGTSGVARVCAPSAMKDVYYGKDGLMPMVAAGYAVVATDFHGLGTAGAHEYLSKLAQARDVIFSVPAARAAVPALGKRWVVDGHSQGGLASWGVAEVEHDLRDSDYLGAVSVASGVREAGFFQHLNATPGLGFVLSYIAFGIHAQYPSFRPENFLSKAALEQDADVTTKGCWVYGAAVDRGIAAGSFLRPHAERNRWVHRYVKGFLLGRVPADGPILVLAGEADQIVPVDGVRATVRHACGVGQQITLRTYPGLDHHSVMVKSTPDQLAWIKARFDGEPATANCPTVGR